MRRSQLVPSIHCNCQWGFRWRPRREANDPLLHVTSSCQFHSARHSHTELPHRLCDHDAKKQKRDSSSPKPTWAAHLPSNQSRFPCTAAVGTENNTLTDSPRRFCLLFLSFSFLFFYYLLGYASRKWHGTI
ncbi:hypothetical protein LX36DRAFT_29513 [Colletotrichum falcatum]|nr:hypothetical protein LX36DRAFT_29513 [Colletotrichum falcatum]